MERELEELERKLLADDIIATIIREKYEIIPNTSVYAGRTEVHEYVAERMGVNYSPQLITRIRKVIKPWLIRPVDLHGRSVYRGLKQKA